MISSAISQVALERKAAGAPVDIAVPKEGIFAMPSGVALVKGGPQPELAAGYINEMIGPEIQAKLSAATYSLPTNKDTPVPAGRRQTRRSSASTGNSLPTIAPTG